MNLDKKLVMVPPTLGLLADSATAHDVRVDPKLPRYTRTSRVSDNTAFVYLGRLVGYGPTDQIFLSPKVKETEDHVTGRFG